MKESSPSSHRYRDAKSHALRRLLMIVNVIGLNLK